ncbi:MAG: flagellar hook-associated protein FlgL [Candidatus Pristimantibacillus lignocellulolyticus]|uniref:Flagellar hook-associated protein FlgL n=1 Tax=Candidatus Pristimantibacillus lignocellulolyticus TaxID=2994561 RepID=A0A9J6ZJ76_9BACL|nr:MAG: flagellar hook-associated protein FlgL [Candidatus Pristimantibacillus lignocellulolyticus]
MRVTSMMQNTQLLRNLGHNNANIMDWQNKLATGEKISKPSDDPVGIGYQMRYTTELSRNEQYLANANTGVGWLSQTDSVLQQANSILQRLNTLVNQAANGTVTPEVREQIGLEVSQLREQMVTIGNSTYDGRYIFNGQKTDQAPYTSANAASDTTDSGVYYLNVSSSVAVEVSLPGETVFGKAGGNASENIFQMFDDIIGHLNGGQPIDQTALSASLNDIDGAIGQISLSLAEVGARMNRFELIQSRIGDEKVSLSTLKQGVADVDMADAIIQLQLQQNVLQASLSVGAKVMQMSLLDYIR